MVRSLFTRIHEIYAVLANDTEDINKVNGYHRN